ncbi:MAG: hypothetical protein GX654_16455 [Desulfatiglans sp.]|nr:hypothetical protein [Desulfatiglans sp.]
MKLKILFISWINAVKIRQSKYLKGKKVEENKRSSLEEQLKKMIENSIKKKEEKERPKTRSGTGNIIRRRAGEKDTRFSTPKTIASE